MAHDGLIDTEALRPAMTTLLEYKDEIMLFKELC
jgi:hypothetical protein